MTPGANKEAATGKYTSKWPNFDFKLDFCEIFDKNRDISPARPTFLSLLSLVNDR